MTTPFHLVATNNGGKVKHAKITFHQNIFKKNKVYLVSYEIIPTFVL